MVGSSSAPPSSPSDPRERASRRRRRIAVALAVLVAVWLLSGLLVATNLVFAPSPRSAVTLPSPAWAEAGVVDVRLTTEDRAKLAAWYFAGRVEASPVVFLHGQGGTRKSYAPVMRELLDRGLPFLAITLRGHGGSTGERYDFGWSSRLDVEAAVRFVEENAPGRAPVLVGASVGAAASIYAAETVGERVRAYVLEAPYASLDEAVRDRCSQRLPFPFDVAAYASLRLWSGVLLEPSLDLLRPIDAVERFPSSVPVVFLASAGDERTPAEDVRELAERCAGRARVEVFESDEHARLAFSHTDEYARIVLELVGSVE